MTATEEKTKYDRYVAEISHDIGETVQQFGCQPILFVGSGLSKRYFGAPNWDDLLSHLAKQCSTITKDFGYYKQSLGDLSKIGEEFAHLYQEWAWSSGHNEFPEALFDSDVPASAYIKFCIAKHLRSITPKDVSGLEKSGLEGEIAALQKIKPHAIITTNYDEMLEVLFPDLEPIVGQQILKGQQVSVGEIYKIHGSVREFVDLVFTSSDYEAFSKKKKFLSAKLLTFFNEHPLLFIGYSATDPNIRAILSDIDQALPEKGGVIPNVYILEWNPEIRSDPSPAREKLIATEEDRSVRVKLIEADSFSWVFEAFASNPSLNDVNPRVLRALIARSYALVRHDIPKMKVEADFKMLNESVEDSDAFAKLFGIANISDYSASSAIHHYSATQLGQALGGKTWHIANALIQRLKTETGFDLRGSDSIYHRAEMINKSTFHKYCEEALLLLNKIRDGEEVEIKVG